MLFFLTESSALLPCTSDEKDGEAENFFGEENEGEGDSFGEEVAEPVRADRGIWELKDLLYSDSSDGGGISASSFISIRPDLDLHGIGEGSTTFSFRFSSNP